MLSSDSRLEVVSTGQQTAIQSLSASSKDNENLLDYLQAKVTTLRSKTTDTSTAVTIMRQYMDLPYLNLNEDPIKF